MNGLNNSYSFSQLSKFCKLDMSGLPTYRLALLGDCATQHLATALRGQAYARGLALEVFDADYDQILPQAMDAGSEMYRFEPDAVLIFMCVERLYGEWRETPDSERPGFAEAVFTRIKGYWEHVGANSVRPQAAVKILQFTFAEYDDGVFGSYACKQPASFIFQLRKLNLLLMSGAAEAGDVFLADLCGVQAEVGRAGMFDPKMHFIAHMSISLAALPAVAARAVDVIMALRGAVKKCVVLDLDNTLWGGVIGDDGLSGIEIGELGSGLAFSEFQGWLKELKKRGVLLAVCSKNEEAAAKEPFEKHEDMVLKLEDISMFVANWEDKASNIRHIQQTLNIGMDSMVFFDDNPFERELVRSLIPDITVPDLPEDPAEYVSCLKGLNLFETASFSAEDAGRTELYRVEAQRAALQQQFADYGEYLQSLEMEAVAAAFDEYHTPRIAQLTQRSNQFNLRTVRYTEAEIAAAAADPNKVTLYFTLKDKLSDHGLISVVIMEKGDKRTVPLSLFIDTWLMSCRVLKRGMEEFIVNKMIETAAGLGFETVIGEYIPTAKNAMVADIYERLGFARAEESERGVIFTASVADFVYNKTYIKERANEPN